MYTEYEIGIQNMKYAWLTQRTWNISNWSRYYIKFQPVPHREHKCPQFKAEPINVLGVIKDIYSENTTKHINILRGSKMRNFVRLNQVVQILTTIFLNQVVRIVTTIFWKVNHKIHV